MGKADWKAIECEYRAGQLSIREIGRQQHVSEGTIRKKAKKEGWERDLTDQVREEVRRQLVRTEDAETTHEECVPSSGGEEKKIVKAAASRAVGVVKLHRADAQKLREVITDLTRILRKHVPIGKENISLSLPELKDASTISRNLSQAQKQIVAIERQAFNIDETPPEDEVRRVLVIFKDKKQDGNREED